MAKIFITCVGSEPMYLPQYCANEQPQQYSTFYCPLRNECIRHILKSEIEFRNLPYNQHTESCKYFKSIKTRRSNMNEKGDKKNDHRRKIDALEK